MPYKWIDPEIFLTHGDVTVYRVYEDDDVSHGCREYWFTTDLYGGDGDDPCSFDVRDLPTYREDKSFEQIMREAIDAGKLTQNGYEE